NQAQVPSRAARATAATSAQRERARHGRRSGLSRISVVTKASKTPKQRQLVTLSSRLERLGCGEFGSVSAGGPLVRDSGVHFAAVGTAALDRCCRWPVPGNSSVGP